MFLSGRIGDTTMTDTNEDNKVLCFKAFTEHDLCQACNSLLRGSETTVLAERVKHVADDTTPQMIVFETSSMAHLIAVLTPLPSASDVTIAIANISTPVDPSKPFTISECGIPQSNLNVLFATYSPLVIEPSSESLAAYCYSKAGYDPIEAELLIRRYSEEAQDVKTRFETTSIH